MLKKFCFTFALLFIVSSTAYGDDQKDSVKFPFFPSLINMNTGKLVKPGDFEDPEICSGLSTGCCKPASGQGYPCPFDS